MKLIKLKEKSNLIQITPEDALETVLREIKPESHVVIVHITKDTWEYYQGGGLDKAHVLWELERIKQQMLNED